MAQPGDECYLFNGGSRMNDRPASLRQQAGDARWQDWRWQMANRIDTVERLKQVARLTGEEEEGIRTCLHNLRMSITPYYAGIMDPEDPHCPLRRQAVPTAAELKISEFDRADPLLEDGDSPVTGLTHRYPDRVLLLVTDRCAMYCRHCTRRRLAGQRDRPLPLEQVRAALAYIRDNRQIRDVLISGGDPLTMPDSRLEAILSSVRAIGHVEIIRIGTRVPVVLPQRITPELVNMLKKYHPLWLNTQFNHPRELTPEAIGALALLAGGGIPLGNQSVLLRGINDCPGVMKKLVQQLVRHRVRPYYLYQCDLARGIGHFRTPVSRGIEIMESLRGHTSGLAVPTYVIDVPGGGGKIPVAPQYLLSMGADKVALRNHEGVIAVYHEPGSPVGTCRCDYCRGAEPQGGVAGLFQRRVENLEPENLDRKERRAGKASGPEKGGRA